MDKISNLFLHIRNLCPTPFGHAVLGVGVILCVAGCTTSVQSTGSHSASLRQSPATTPTPVGTDSPRSHAQRDEARLAQLWAQRAGDSMTADYPLGPGDVLEISVPGMVELERQSDTGHIVRVSREGTISLPFIGIMQAGGLTEKTLKEAIRSRLERDYMDNPR